MINGVYLDNAATTFPKPQEVHDYMYKFYQELGVNPGRSGYDLSIEVEDVVLGTRKALTDFFNGTDPERCVFSYNASDSLNTIINGVTKKGDHVISTRLEHNSVLRPLHMKTINGVIEVDYVPADINGYVDPDDFRKKIKSNTKLVIVNHASNVLGTVQPITEIGKICREKGILFSVDAAQSAGMIPVNMQESNIDMLAFTGHKSLFGPTGIGGICIREGLDLEPLRVGGTGVRSALLTYLPEYPFRLECGTLNIVGVAGLYAGQKYIKNEGMENIHKKEMGLYNRFVDGLKKIDGIKTYCADSDVNHTAVVATNIEGMNPADVGIMLDVDHNIYVRTGLQCAPFVHETIGTDPKGTVRFSMGYFNTEEHIDYALGAFEEIAKDAQKRK